MDAGWMPINIIQKKNSMGKKSVHREWTPIGRSEGGSAILKETEIFDENNDTLKKINQVIVGSEFTTPRASSIEGREIPK
mmetsp:Transcript_31794/g.31212  ORF Transcript_31794/g.31212 Transcript_31794/m.31212 type:complete len:80 (+) Transcript_31794:831-1070(+)